jgi:hypothetical protein
MAMKAFTLSERQTWIYDHGTPEQWKAVMGEAMEALRPEGGEIYTDDGIVADVIEPDRYDAL